MHTYEIIRRDAVTKAETIIDIITAKNRTEAWWQAVTLAAKNGAYYGVRRAYKTGKKAKKS